MKTVTANQPHLTTLNLILIIAGLTIACVGMYRTAPLVINASFKYMNYPLAALVVLGGVILAMKPSPHCANTCAYIAVNAGSKFFPLMVLLCIAMGMSAVLASIHEKIITDAMLRHPTVGFFFASIVSPTTNVFLPIVEKVWTQAESLRPNCVMFLQGSALASIPLFMMRQTGFGPKSEIPPKMYAAGFIVSVMMFIMMRPIYWLTELVCDWSGTTAAAIELAWKHLV